ncbi:glycosyltransferase family 2 protein, partial [Candidatus Woesearchaeota archaeon]|nr:glycosyltransferase family 2 protein [Candidatus Woesearchaeota archaeon]
MGCMKEISVVIPVYNEEPNVAALYQKLTEALEGMTSFYELIYVDDGSRDKTFDVLKELAKKDKHLRVLRFRRNFGKAAALSAGFEAAQGKVVFTMDGDLQDSPSEMPRFLEKLKEGYDLVNGWKVKRKDPLSKTLPSKIFNRLTSCVTGVKVHDSNCGFKAYRREVLDSLVLYGELHRYIPALVALQGFRVGEIPVKHFPRKYGNSKYGVSRLFKGFLDLMTVRYLMSYKDRPLHLFGLIGLVLAFLGSLLGA